MFSIEAPNELWIGTLTCDSVENITVTVTLTRRGNKNKAILFSDKILYRAIHGIFMCY